VRSRRLILAAGWLLFALSACAPKTVAPVIPGAPHYPEFVFPAAAAGAGSCLAAAAGGRSARFRARVLLDHQDQSGVLSG
jgi:hypothetical protein